MIFVNLKRKMEIDYEKLGFKCGIEIHQQLNTRKLFCDCPSEIRDDEPDIKVRRKMRAVAGELGNVDPAALHEFLRNREIIYEAYSDSNCLVELDEEPPHLLNEDALNVAIEIALLLNAKPFSELHVMRKTVIDGSNPSGFQRTILIATDGFIETSLGKVKIPTICLEEDSARKIKEDGRKVVYRLDRLGIPLIEIGTLPDIKSPEHAREVAEKLGRILRATKKVKRGLGTIRQDINVSISEGERIEIKGVQDLRLISRVIENEVKRQLMLIEIKKELKRRGIKRESIDKENFINVTDVFKNTKSKIIGNFIKKNGVVMAVKLKGFSGLLKGKLGPELAEYAKSCNVKGIFHSDELPAYGISEKEVKEVYKKLNMKEKGMKKEYMDAFVLVAEIREEVAKNALKEVIRRCKMAFDGVPKETRKAKDDGSTKFMRPLPGSERMYPETDEPFIEIDNEKIDEIRNNLPKLPSDVMNELIEIGLGKELASQISKSEVIDSFWRFIRKYKKLKPSIIATTLFLTPKEINRRYKVEIKNLNENHFDEVFKFLSEGKITKENILEILLELAKNPKKHVNEIINEKNLSILSDEEVERFVEKIIKENLRKVKEFKKEKAIKFVMGLVMSKLRGRIRNPKEIIKLIEKKFKEEKIEFSE